MTMSKVATIKLKLGEYLGHKEFLYWDILSSFFNGRVTKAEFEDLLAPILAGPNLGMSDPRLRSFYAQMLL